MFHSASKEGEAETGGAEGQEAVFQRAADDPAVQKRQRSNFDGDVVCDGDDDTDRNRFVVYLLIVPTAESTGMVKKNTGPRLREIAPAARGSQDAESRNLGPAFMTILE